MATDETDHARLIEINELDEELANIGLEQDGPTLEPKDFNQLAENSESVGENLDVFEQNLEEKLVLPDVDIYDQATLRLNSQPQPQHTISEILDVPNLEQLPTESGQNSFRYFKSPPMNVFRKLTNPTQNLKITNIADETVVKNLFVNSRHGVRKNSASTGVIPEVQDRLSGGAAH